MGWRRSRKCQVYLLFNLNFILMLIGLAIVGISVISCMEPEVQTVFDVAGVAYVTHILTIVLISVGSATIAVAIFGFCGIYRESACLISIYCTCLALVICVEVAVGVLSILYHQEAEEKVVRALKTVIDDWFTKSSDPGFEAQKIVNREVFQSFLECCGGRGRADYGDVSLPLSCCPSPTDVCDVTAYSVGCYERTTTVVNSGLQGFTGVVLAIASCEMISLLLSLLFFFTVVRRNSGSEYVAVPQR
ncbi:tetraspanin [Echinococcus multilocularis]|uniref:Tetraspanin n=1 Tax=Echinococcus multilocularis TaxID=6211 RepID=A0A068YLB2_ECHMU|nr:tetraspanin [Echinococcus multilocularis]